jgi:hypothetical protein
MLLILDMSSDETQTTGHHPSVSSFVPGSTPLSLIKTLLAMPWLLNQTIDVNYSQCIASCSNKYYRYSMRAFIS